MLDKRRLLADKYATDDLIEHADGVSYVPVDQLTAVAHPGTIAHAWHVEEFTALGEEQEHLFTAQGENSARRSTVRAAQRKPARDAALHGIAAQVRELASAQAARDLAHAALDGLVRREAGAKGMYRLRWALLLGGDVAGISGASILLGEIPQLALAQAFAAAIAAVTAGVVGKDLRDAYLRRQRARSPQSVPTEHRQYERLICGVGAGEKIVVAMILVAITAMLLIVGGIFALRTGVEGELGGIVFGALAGAICLASALNCWDYADEVADAIQRAEERYAKADKLHGKRAKDRGLVQYEGAAAEAASIQRESAASGKAARSKITALMHGVSRRNPSICGHGPAPAAAPHTPAVPSILLRSAPAVLDGHDGHDGQEPDGNGHDGHGHDGHGHDGHGHDGNGHDGKVTQP
jgi:hypothetical protein